MALVVMIILMVIFSGGTDKANTGLFDCASKGGTCVPPGECGPKGGTESMVFDCPNLNEEGGLLTEVYRSITGNKGEEQVCCFKEKK